MTTTTKSVSLTLGTESVKIGRGAELDVDFSRFTADVLSHLVSIGIRNVLRDVHAGEKSDEKAIQKSVDKLESLYRGEVHRAAAPGVNAALKATIAENEAKIAELEAKLAAMAADKPKPLVKTNGVVRRPPSTRK